MTQIPAEQYPVCAVALDLSERLAPSHKDAVDRPIAQEQDARPKTPNDPTKMTQFWKFTRLVCRPIMALLYDLKVYGRQHVPLNGGVLLVSNHQSYLDPVLIAVYLERQMSYMAKRELFESRFFAWIIRALNTFPIKQGKSDKSSIKETIARLKEGFLLNIFPEGARTFSGELGQIEPGAALVIRRAGVPVVPCVIQGSFEAWPRTVKMPRRHPIAVMYGRPLQVEGLKPAEIKMLIDQTLQRMIAELRRRDGRCDPVSRLNECRSIFLKPLKI